MKVIQQFLSSDHRLRAEGSYPKTTITVHSTGNAKSTAWNERNWLDNPSNTREASWHYVVGEDTVLQALPDDAEAWHCAVTEGNRHSLSIEICESGDRRQTLLNAAWLTAVKAEELGLTENEIRKHFDWNGKNCPRILIDPQWIQNGLDWAWFITEVKKDMALITQTEKRELITQEQFDQMMDSYLARRAKLEPAGWSENARKWAEDNEIMVGDENGEKRYGSFVTREELAVVLNKITEVFAH